MGINETERGFHGTLGELMMIHVDMAKYWTIAIIELWNYSGLIYIYIYIIIYNGIYNGIFVIPTHAFFHPIRIVKDKYFHENPNFSDRNVHVVLFICSRFYRTICGISPCYKLGGR